MSEHVRGRNKSPYILTTDLFQEPTQRSLELSTIDYVPFLNSGNNLLNEINSIINTSPTNRGIIQQKKTLITGDGFNVETRTECSLIPAFSRTEQKEPEESAVMSLCEYIDKVNPEGENLLELVNKVAFDYGSFGNAFIELQKQTISGQTFFIQRHVPVHMCRPKKVDETRVIKFIGVSDRWEEGEINPEDVKDLPLFPNFAEIEGLEGERSIIHIRDYAPGFFYWGVPDWVAAFLWGELEYRIPKWNQSKFINGYTPSAIVNFFGQMSQQEAQALVDDFKDKFTNTGNNSKMFVQVLSDESMKSDVQILDDKKDGSFMELSELARQNIVTAHRWTMSLAGMGVAGQLGSNQQIRSEFEIVNNMIIRPIQALLESKWINPSLKEANEWISGQFADLVLKLKSSIPISFIGDLKPENVLTVNEQREAFKLPPMEATGIQEDAEPIEEPNENEEEQE